MDYFLLLFQLWQRTEPFIIISKPGNNTSTIGHERMIGDNLGRTDRSLVNNMNSSTHPFIPAVEPQSRTRDPDDDLLLESVWHWPLPMIWLRWSSSCSLAITTCCTSVSRSGWRQDGSMWTGAISKGDISSPSIPRPIPAPSAPSLGDISSPLPPKIGAAARHVSGLSVPWSGEAEEMKCQVKGQPLYHARPLHEVKVWSRRQTATWP